VKDSVAPGTGSICRLAFASSIESSACICIRSSTSRQDIEAVKQWTFSPAKKDGNPISMATTVQVEFRL
jgi:hypothetical protein